MKGEGIGGGGGGGGGGAAAPLPHSFPAPVSLPFARTFNSRITRFTNFTPACRKSGSGSRWPKDRTRRGSSFSKDRTVDEENANGVVESGEEAWTWGEVEKE